MGVGELAQSNAQLRSSQATASPSMMPRNDFMNWSLVDAGTFDYAADAWGYTYGAAVEWYRGNWALRGGLFDLSVVPNNADLDPRFQQFQWVGEIEHRHELWGLRPGAQNLRAGNLCRHGLA